MTCGEVVIKGKGKQFQTREGKMKRGGKKRNKELVKRLEGERKRTHVSIKVQERERKQIVGKKKMEEKENGERRKMDKVQQQRNKGNVGDVKQLEMVCKRGRGGQKMEGKDRYKWKRTEMLKIRNNSEDTKDERKRNRCMERRK